MGRPKKLTASTSFADILEGRVAFPDIKPDAPPMKKLESAETVVGECAVCSGNIVEDWMMRHSDRIGGPPAHHVHDGYHCANCGVVYKFIPPKRSAFRPVAI